MKPCPIPGCTCFIPEKRFLCIGHWEQVPAGLQKRVIQAKRHARQYGSEQWRKVHVEAQEAAIASVTDQPQEKAA